MSWENHERKRPCPCAHSTITSKWKDGDWPGQYVDLGEEMDCENCRLKYEYKAVHQRSDDHSLIMDWVKKDSA